MRAVEQKKLSGENFRTHVKTVCKEKTSAILPKLSIRQKDAPTNTRMVF